MMFTGVSWFGMLFLLYQGLFGPERTRIPFLIGAAGLLIAGLFPLIFPPESLGMLAPAEPPAGP